MRLLPNRDTSPVQETWPVQETSPVRENVVHSGGDAIHQMFLNFNLSAAKFLKVVSCFRQSLQNLLLIHFMLLLLTLHNLILRQT